MKWENMLINKNTEFKLGFNITEDNRNKIFIFTSLFIFLILIYHNSFNCEWVFDDIPNIVENKSIHISSLSYEDLKNAFTQYKGSRVVTRPIAYLSFALNYYFGGLNVFGYHVVNFVIHYISAIFLFLFIYETLNLPSFQKKYSQYAYSISALSVFFWASSPLNVCAVTYIVQRMTCLAGMAYIICLYSYVKARLSVQSASKLFYFFVCILFFLISVLVKENSAMLIFIVLLYEMFFFRNTSSFRNKFAVIIPAVILFAFVGGTYIVFWSQHISFRGWSFSLQ